MNAPTSQRCQWAGSDPLYCRYHDTEWGSPLHNDRQLFEFLVLEGAQAGLSWITILKKRENYRHAFDNFNPEKIAAYTEKKIASLLKDEGIVRNRLKVAAAVTNARAFMAVQTEYGTFDQYIWQFVNGEPIQNTWRNQADVPAETEISHRMSAALKKKGFRFVGPTICYAFMQAVGMVNDHVIDCYRHAELSRQS